MQATSVLVLGAGVAGLSTALLLARDGHTVRVFERDPAESGGALDAAGWTRKGVPHYLQPHAFTPRGCLELSTRFPDVYQMLLDEGASEIDGRPKIPGDAIPGDEQLRYLGVRRPVIEWALRKAAQAERRIELEYDVRIEGVTVEDGRVSGVRRAGEHLSADLVVDALGRRSPVGRWLAEAGCESVQIETSDCGVVYYSRYYKVRPGFSFNDGPWVLGPRGDLGYLGFATFPGDNATFATLLAVPTGAPEWRVLKEDAQFDAATAAIPVLRQWVDPANIDAILPVHALAGMHNSVRTGDGALPVGIVSVGDALSHTDPVFAHGLAFSLIHAAALADAMRQHADLTDAQDAYAAVTSPALHERYELATAFGEQRLRMWTGGPVNPSSHTGDYALFSMVAAGVASMVDPDIFRMFTRRVGLLDSTSILDDDLALQLRIGEIFRTLSATPRPPSGPSRQEMLKLLGAHSE